MSNSQYARPATLRGSDLRGIVELLQAQRTRALDVITSAGNIGTQNGLFVVRNLPPTISDDGVDDPNGAYTLTRAAERGLAAKLNIPSAWLRDLRTAGRFDVYDPAVNSMLHGYDPDADEADPYEQADPYGKNLLVRILRGDETNEGYVRAVLSDTYKVIDSLDVLLAVLAGIREAGVNAEVREADLTESNMFVKIWSPEVRTYAAELLANYDSPFNRGAVRWGNAGGWTIERAREAARREGQGYEPGKEPVVFAGFVVKNSETGEGRYGIYPQIIMEICGNGLTFTADAIAKTHLGARLDEGVIRYAADTEATNLELIRKQSRDAVKAFLSSDYVEGKVRELTEAAGVPVEAPKDTIKVVAKKLQFSDGEAEDILAHFLMGGQRTAGGIMQAVSSVAQTLEDADRAFELEAKAPEALVLAGAAAK